MSSTTMKALSWTSIGHVKLIDHPKPIIHSSTDAIVKVTHASICGTDVHTRDGVHPESGIGRILGHEGVGYVESVGTDVKKFRVGDRVIVMCITTCSSCDYCHRSMPGHCTTGGWQLGHTLDGLQAEYTRVPYADTSMHLIPRDADAKAMVLMSDVFPSGFEVGVLRGKVHPGSTLAIIGVGPIGLASLITAQLYSPSIIIAIDNDPKRLGIAKTLGADFEINARTEDVEATLKSFTDGKGCDTVIEAVGFASTIDLAQSLVAVGGTIANIGVHSTKVDLHLHKSWAQNISITTGLNDGITAPLLLKMHFLGKLKSADPMFTHKFSFRDIEEAYSIFSAGVETGAVKILIEM